jgi:hypothetical protein
MAEEIDRRYGVDADRLVAAVEEKLAEHRTDGAQPGPRAAATERVEAAALAAEADVVGRAVRAEGVVDAHERAHNVTSGWDDAARWEVLAARLDAAMPSLLTPGRRAPRPTRCRAGRPRRRRHRLRLGHRRPATHRSGESRGRSAGRWAGPAAVRDTLRFTDRYGNRRCGAGTGESPGQRWHWDGLRQVRNPHPNTSRHVDRVLEDGQLTDAERIELLRWPPS